jgi:hypothetical protein
MIQTLTQPSSVRRDVATRLAVALASLLCVVWASAQEPIPGLDAFEPARLDETVALGNGALVVPTVGTGFLYVVKDGKRIWKSPKAHQWFGMWEAKPDRLDLDGDGAPDVAWYGYKPHFAYEFGVFLSLRGGAENFLVHFDPHGRVTGPGSDGAPLVTASSRLPTEVAKRLATFVETIWKDSPTDVAPFVEQLRRGTYAITRDPREAYPELAPLHARAVALFRQKKVREARLVLDPFFRAHDVRRIDPENRHPEFTAMLNDYAFFLSEDRGDPETLPLLAYVIERDPGRAAAYLNMADELCRPDDEPEAARYPSLAAGYYRKYLELMTAAGNQKRVPKRVRERLQAGSCGRSP